MQNFLEGGIAIISQTAVFEDFIGKQVLGSLQDAHQGFEIVTVGFLFVFGGEENHGGDFGIRVAQELGQDLGLIDASVFIIVQIFGQNVRRMQNFGVRDAGSREYPKPEDFN